MKAWGRFWSAVAIAILDGLAVIARAVLRLHDRFKKDRP